MPNYVFTGRFGSMPAPSDDLLGRALSTYYRNHGSDAAVPTREISGHRWIDTKEYIVLQNGDGVLAVFRVRYPSGHPMLKSMKRWPRELEQTS